MNIIQCPSKRSYGLCGRIPTLQRTTLPPSPMWHGCASLHDVILQHYYTEISKIQRYENKSVTLQ